MADAAGDTDVLVAGAGPAGAALAYLLASRGVRTILVERQLDSDREFRGEALMPSGLEALEALGIDVDALPHSVPSRFELFLRARCVARVGAEALERDGRRPRTVSQPALLEGLVERGGAHDTFRLLRGAALRDLRIRDGRVVGARIETRDGSEELGARLVVGADGRASAVRRRGGFTARARHNPMDVVWAKVPWPAAWAEPLAQAYVGGGHLLLALPAPDGMLQLAWVILKGTFRELRSQGVSEWVRDMADHVAPELADHLRAHASGIERPFLLDAVTDFVDGWYRPGALLVGDAAHTMSPVGGQGINLALRDAVVAANHLVPALRSGGDLDAAARAVEDERAPEIRRIQRLAARPPRVVLGRRPWHRAIRSLLAVLLARGVAPPGLSVADAFLSGVRPVRLEV